MSSYFTISTCSEIVCFLVSVFCLSKDKSQIWRNLAFYLFLVCLIEFLGVYIKLTGRPNSWIYNILLLFEIGIISSMFHKIMNGYVKNNYVFIGSLLLLVAVYIFDVSIHGIFKRNYYTNITFGVLIILSSLMYFYYLLRDESYIDLKYSAEFWWVFGTFFYYFVSTTLNLFYPVLATMISKYKDTFYYIYQMLNLIQYACWGYSFLCRKKLVII